MRESEGEREKERECVCCGGVGGGVTKAVLHVATGPSVHVRIGCFPPSSSEVPGLWLNPPGSNPGIRDGWFTPGSMTPWGESHCRTRPETDF